MQKKLESVLKIIIALTFFVPLIFLPRSFIFPFIVPKMVIFRSLAILLLGGYILLVSMYWGKFRVRFTPVTTVVALFLLSFTVSTFVGVDWYRSFWDNHERMLGLFSVLHYGIYYAVVTSVIKEWRDWRVLLRAFLFAGALVMGIAAIQRVNPEFFLNRSGSRTASTLGNPIYVGGYGLFLAAIGWLLLKKETIQGWRIFAAVGGFLGVLGVFFSGSRGAFLGFATGVFVLFLCYVLLLRDHTRLRRAFAVTVLIGMVAFGTLWIFRNSTIVDHLPSAVARLVRDPLKATSTRPMAWGIALKSWVDKPILGWGPSNFYYAFNQYYRPEFLRFGYGETWFDNAHNIVLNTLAERGLVGELIFLSLFVVTITYIWKGYRKGEVDIHIVALGTAFLVAHLVQTVSVFENPTSYLYFFFMLAFLNAQRLPGVANEAEKRGVLSPGIAAVAGFAVILLIYTTNVNPARANMAALDALREIYAFRDARPAFARAASIPTPHIDDIRNDFGRAVSTNLRGYVQAGQSPLAQALFEVANAEFTKNREVHPRDIRIHTQQALMLQEVANLSGDRSHLLEAEKLIEESLSYSPKRQQLQYTLAGVKVQLQKLDEAEAIYRQTIENDEKIGEGWWRLALLYDFRGDSAQALAIIQEAESKGVGFNADGLQVIAQIRAKGATSTAPTSP